MNRTREKVHKIIDGYVTIEFGSQHELEEANIGEIKREFNESMRACCPHELFGEIDDTIKKEIEKIQLRNDSGFSNNKQKADKKKRGRPCAKPFEEYIKPDAPKGLMAVLDELLKGKTGKHAALIIIAITDYWIDKPATMSVCQRFPSVKRSAFNEARKLHYYEDTFKKAHPFTKDEMGNIRTTIRNKLLQ